MAQLLQNIYTIAPLLVMIVLVGAAAGGVWLVVELRRRSVYTSYSLSDRLFMKRNAGRMRKMQLH